ncbi:MAG: hypothetical protein QNJ53_28955 [Pleurocapsa sp. MO_192.B19]|nr:hypothetical protein [Pleurocapsa sp. MO_192.B19]
MVFQSPYSRVAIALVLIDDRPLIFINKRSLSLILKLNHSTEAIALPHSPFPCSPPRGRFCQRQWGG